MRWQPVAVDKCLHEILICCRSEIYLVFSAVVARKACSLEWYSSIPSRRAKTAYMLMHIGTHILRCCLCHPLESAGHQRPKYNWSLSPKRASCGENSFPLPLQVGVTMGVFYFLLLVAVGTAMFKVSGDMSVIDALYLTVVSSSTVGYGARGSWLCLV